MDTAPEAFLATGYGWRQHVASGPVERFAPWATSARLMDDLACELQRVFQAGVRIVSSADAEGSVIPQRDALLLRLAGENRWRIGEEEVTVRPGDALYVPMSLERRVLSGGPVKELCFEIQTAAGSDLLASIAQSLKAQPSLRAALPRHSDPAAQAGFADSLRRTVASVLRSPGLLDAYCKSLDDAAPGCVLESEAFDASSASTQWMLLATPRRLRVQRASDDALSIVVGGETILFPPDAAPLLQFMAEETPAPVSLFYSTFGNEFEREDLTSFLATLAARKLIALRQPGDLIA